ncbi:MAG: hypothetical protein ACKOPP_02045 [Bacteroidota bacterium]
MLKFNTTSRVGLLWVAILLGFLPYIASSQISVTVGTGTQQNSGNTYPAPYGNFYWGARHQMLVRASELNALGITAGGMTSVGFMVMTPAGIPLQNFTISLGTTTDTVLSTNTGFVGGMTQVYSVPTYTDVVGWNTHVFSQPFFWAGTTNLIIETCFNNTNWVSNGNAVVQQTNLGYTGTLVFRQDALGTCTAVPPAVGTSFFGSTQRPNMQLNFLPLTGTDAAATGLLSPAPPVLGGSSGQVVMRISNYAANTITSASVGYSVNNGAPVTESWTGSLPTGQSTTHTFTSNLTLPLTQPAVVKAWVRNPVPGPDINANNDTVSVNLCYALPGGTYLVGPGAGAAFPSLTAAFQAMRCGGITGPVTLQLQSGVHLGSYSLGSIAGLSASSSLTLTSATGNAADVILVGDTSASGVQRSIFKLAQTPHVTFQNLTLRRYRQNSSASGGTLTTAHIEGTGTDFLQVNQCIFQDSVTQAFVTRDNYGIFLVGGSNGVISNNVFRGFYIAVAWSGQGPVMSLNQVLNNNFEGYLEGINATDQSGMLVSGNVFNNQRVNGNAALWLADISSCEVHSNRFGGEIFTPQIRITNANDTLGQPTRVYNNAVNASFNPTSTFGFGSPFLIEGFADTSSFFPDPKDGVVFAFNTARIRCTGMSGAGGLNYGLFHFTDNRFMSGGGSPFATLVLRNNNGYAEAAPGFTLPNGWAAMVYESDSIASYASSNYNNLYLKPVAGQVTQPNLVGYSNPLLTFTALAPWRTLTGKDSNSVSLNPLFISPSLAVPGASAYNDLGTPFGGIGTDLTGSSRNGSTPDIGAYEFTPAPNDVGVVQLVGPGSGCGLGSALSVSVRVSNFGSVAQSNFGLGYSMAFGPVVTGTFTGTLNPGDTALFTFPGTVNLSAPGSYAFTAFTTLGSDGQLLNDTLQATVLNSPLTGSAPYLENFETTAPGWVSSGTNSSWQRGTPAGLVINTAGGGTQSFMTNLIAPYNALEWSYLESPCMNLSGTTSPQVRFKIWWETERNWDGLQLQYSTNGGGSWTVLGAVGSAGSLNWYNTTLANGPGTGMTCWSGSQTSVPSSGSGGWVTAIHPLPGLAGVSGVKFRFVFVSDASIQADGVAIDDFRVSDPPPVEAEMMRLTLPSSACGLPANAPIIVRIKNNGTTTLTNLPVRYRINNLPVVQEVAAGPILPGDSLTYTFTARANLSTAGTYAMLAYVAVTGDADLSNDTLRGSVTHVPTVSNFPYTENFEANNGSWFSGGLNSTWAWGTPAGSVINNAASGQRAWVTNLTGSYNADENSFLQMPCFNFTGIQNATLSFSLHYDTEDTYDGLQVQYSTNNGLTWLVLGNVGSGTNWYTNASVSSSNGPVWDGTSSGWVRVSHPLTVLNNRASARIRLVFTSDPSVQQEGVAIDSVVISTGVSNTPDLGVVQILEPTTPILNQNNTVKVVIKNFSSSILNNFLVSYSVNGTLVNGNTLSRSVQPNDTIHHTFTGLWRPSVGGTHRLCAYTGPVPGQTNNANDTACRVYTAVGLYDPNPTGILLYPNPTKDRVLLQAESGDYVALTWRDAGGRLLSEQFLDFCLGGNEGAGSGLTVTTETGAWAPGWYFGTLTKRDGTAIRLRLMVQP